MTSNYQTNAQQRATGMLIALIGVIFMSLDPIFIRFAGVSGADSVFLFGLFTSISMPTVLKLIEKRSLLQICKDSGWPLIATSSLMFISSSAFVLSVKHTSIANTFIILSVTPVISAFASYFLLKERLSKSIWLTIGTIILGVLIVANGSVQTTNILGDLMALISVFCLALTFVLMRKYQDVNRLAAVGLAGFMIAVIMYPFAEPASYNINTWLYMAVMGLFTAPIGRALSMTATRYISASEVSMTMVLDAVLASIWAYIFFAEVPPINSVLGGVIILISLTTYTWLSYQSDTYRTKS